MTIGRTLPPAAVPFTSNDIVNGIAGWRRGKDEIERFRLELRQYFQKRYCFLVSSGKAALYLILKALGDLRPHCDTVLIPAFTCYSVPSAIVRAGLDIGLCDIDPRTLDFDARQLNRILHPGPAGGSSGRRNRLERAAREDRLLAVMPTHLFGMTARVDPLRHLIAGRPIALIEDAAQAFGARSDGGFSGCRADVGFFSLGRGKSFSTVEGGVIVTDREDIARRLDIRIAQLTSENHKQSCRLLIYAMAIAALLHPSRYWLPSSLPFLNLGQTIFDPDFSVRPFTAFQAGLARGWQARYAKLRDIRGRHYLAWQKALAALDGTVLRSMSVSEPAGNLIRYPLRVPESTRTRILDHPDARRLGVQPAYPHSIDQLSNVTTQPISGTCEQARKVARELLTLPMHAYVEESDRRNITRLLVSRRSASQVRVQ
jgi:perosamine synthetase